MSSWREVRKVLLAQPPSGLYRRDDRCQSRVEDQTIQVVFPPIDLAVMAAALERDGVECRILDAPAARISWDESKAILQAFAPDVVLVSVTQPTLGNDRRWAEEVRQARPQVRIGAKGEIFTADDPGLLGEVREFDFALRGECDLTLAEMIRSGGPQGVAGVTYRADGRISRNPDRPWIEDPDSLPFPARHLLDNDLYRSPENGRRLTTIQAARGCPAPCIFCSVRIALGSRIRQRSPDNILAELTECVEQYRIRDFLFHADTFTWNRDWVIDLCKKIVEAGLAIRWGCNSRLDTIDGEELAWMKRAGCWVIGFGIESANKESLRRIRKGTGPDQALEAASLCREAGIRFHAFFVFGFPWETEEHILETIRFAGKLDPDFFDFNIAYPLKGTELYDMVVKEGLLDPAKVRDGGYASASVSTRTVSSDRLEELRKKALWGMYLRPRYVIRTLLRSGSPRGVYYYGRAAYRRVRGLLGA